jgi:hypothetical protein
MATTLVSSENFSRSLEISFHGPFVFDFCRQAVVVHAPQCDGHFGSVQMDTSEAGLLGRTQGANVKGGAGAGEGEDPYLYEIRGDFGASSPSEICFVNPDEVKLVANTRCRETTPNPLDCHWQLVLPLPHLVVGLIADKLKIWEYDLPTPPNPGDSLPRATAVRLIYRNYDPAKPVEVVQASPGTPKTIAVSRFNPPISEFRIAIRYASSSPSDDHRDAEECFLRMRALFPPLGAWKVEFESALDRRTSDCKAPIIALVTEDMLKGASKRPA